MAYKNKDKQKEANRQASQRRRDKAKGMTQGMTNQGMTVIDEPPNVIPEQALNKCQKRLAKRGKDIKCFEDLRPDIQATIRRLSDTNEEFKRRTAIAIQYQHLFPDRFEPKSDSEFFRILAETGYPRLKVRVPKPGDEDYNGVCTPEWIAEMKAG